MNETTWEALQGPRAQPNNNGVKFKQDDKAELRKRYRNAWKEQGFVGAEKRTTKISQTSIFGEEVTRPAMERTGTTTKSTTTEIKRVIETYQEGLT